MVDQFHLRAKDTGGTVIAEGDSPELHFKLSKVGVVVRVAETAVEPADVELRFKDAAGKPLDGDCVLEYADGRAEPGHVDGGVLKIPNKDAKGLKVHFPQLLEAKLTEDNVDEGKEAEVVFKHSFIKAGTQAKIAFLKVEDDQDEGSAGEQALNEISVPLAGDEKTLLQPQETKAKWPLTGVEKLEKGQMFIVLCKVSVDALEIEAGHLHVHGPVEDEE